MPISSQIKCLLFFLFFPFLSGQRFPKVRQPTNQRSSNLTTINGNRSNSNEPPKDPPLLPSNLRNNTNDYAVKPTIGNSSNLVGVRIRFNEPVFTETARLFQSVFSYQVQSVQIGSYQQCFIEGCFVLSGFHISGFQKPRAITLRPMQPNKLLLNIFAFDVDIVGSINGNLQILLNVPVQGQIIANARQISVTATFDLQKDQSKVPHLRTSDCRINTGYVNAQKEMIDKTREIISMTICANIEKTIRDQVNQRFKEMPKHVSLYELFQYLDHTAAEVQPRPSVARDSHSLRQYRTHLQETALQFRHKRRAEMQGVATVVEILSADIQDRSKTLYRSPKSRTKFRQVPNNNENQVLDEISEEETETSKAQTNDSDSEAADLNSSTNRSPTTKRVGSRPSNSDGWKNISMKAITPTRTTYVVKPMSVAGLKGFLDTIDNSLARLFVNLDFLDSVSDDDSFTVGMDGSILLNASPYSGNYGDPLNSEEAAKLQFPPHVNHRSMEVVIGEFTPDEICISDSIPEVGEKYPNKLLDIVVESVRPPRFVIGEDEFRIMMIGNAIFYLTESRHEIGKIPFSTIVRVGVRAIDQVLHVNLTIPHLEILDDINFFELPPESLGGFKDAVKGAIENMAKKMLVNGLDMNILGQKLAKYGINNIDLQLFAEGILLMQADVDVYKLIFEDESLDRNFLSIPNG
ncbi:hypothetical protein M3Y98_00122800 [Aphelenchoides besseyi]|nr:hypothetical protein M3Y98_00122800 [Aphelenchoides besseyi]